MDDGYHDVAVCPACTNCTRYHQRIQQSCARSISAVLDMTDAYKHHLYCVVAGKDATQDFEEIGHSKSARDMLDKYLLGEFAVSSCYNGLMNAYEDCPASGWQLQRLGVSPDAWN